MSDVPGLGSHGWLMLMHLYNLLQNIQAAGMKVRIATYNVLAEIYATQQMYPYCDHWALNWNYRKINLLREIKEVGADVLFLQEVQADHYEKHILPELSDEGYEGLYKHKTRESMGATGKVSRVVPPSVPLSCRSKRQRLIITYVLCT